MGQVECNSCVIVPRLSQTKQNAGRSRSAQKYLQTPRKIRGSELHSRNQKRTRVTCKAPYVGSIPARASNPPKLAEARQPAGAHAVAEAMRPASTRIPRNGAGSARWPGAGTGEPGLFDDEGIRDRATYPVPPRYRGFRDPVPEQRRRGHHRGDRVRRALADLYSYFPRLSDNPGAEQQPGSRRRARPPRLPRPARPGRHRR